MLCKQKLAKAQTFIEVDGSVKLFSQELIHTQAREMPSFLVTSKDVCGSHAFSAQDSCLGSSLVQYSCFRQNAEADWQLGRSSLLLASLIHRWSNPMIQ